MNWRKWIVRGIVFTIVGVVGCGAFLYQRFTNPTAMREQILVKLHEILPGSTAVLGSARLRLLGGTEVSELRLCRRDDPSKADLLHVPTAVLYHDKEKILDGKVILRKIELQRPLLYLRRLRDGSWNFQGITGILHPELAIPTVVIHDGTLRIEDKTGVAPLSQEFTHVELTVINDPLASVSLDGSALSALTGKVSLQGTWQRDTGSVDLKYKANSIVLHSLLTDILANTPFGDKLRDVQLDGMAEVAGNFSYNPASPIAVSQEASIIVSDAKLNHPSLPLSLEKLDAAFHIANGNIVLERLKARSGGAEIEAHGFSQLPNIEDSFEFHLAARHIELNDDLASRLPEKLKALQQMYQARGPANFNLACARRDGQWTSLGDGSRSVAVLQPESFSACCTRFRYAVDKLSGVIDHDLMARATRVDVTAYAGSRPVFIKGTWQGDGPQAEGEFDIQASDIPLDDKLVEALQGSSQKLARDFHATGKGDIKAYIRHDAGAPDYHTEYHVRFHDCAIQWEAFPYPLQEVAGILDIYPQQKWEFRGGKGTNRGALVSVEGNSLHTPNVDGATGIAVRIAGRQVPLDADLFRALQPMPSMVKTWNIFQPSARMNFQASIDRQFAGERDTDVRVEVNGCTVQPVFFPFSFDDVAGQFRYHANNLEVVGVTARHGKTRVSLPSADIKVYPQAAYYADLPELQFQGLVFDDDLVAALPANSRGIVAGLHVQEPMSLRTRLVVRQDADGPPVIFWNGMAWLKDANLVTGIALSNVNGILACKGCLKGRQFIGGVKGNLELETATVFHQPFQDVSAHFEIDEATPAILNINVKAPLFGGDISGPIRLDLDSPLHYELNLTASQIDLKQFGSHNLGEKNQLAGIAVGRVVLTGLSTGADSLDGDGSIDVPQGRLLNLPFLLDLLKFLGLRLPDSTAFEEVHAQFGIHGRRVTMRRIELFGNAISLTGKGDFDLDGSNLNLDFYPTWRVDQFLPPIVRTLPPTVSKNLLTIEVRGKVGANPEDLKFNKKFVPLLTDPLLQIRDMMMRTTPTMDRRPSVPEGTEIRKVGL